MRNSPTVLNASIHSSSNAARVNLLCTLSAVMPARGAITLSLLPAHWFTLPVSLLRTCQSSESEPMNCRLELSPAVRRMVHRRPKSARQTDTRSVSRRSRTCLLFHLLVCSKCKCKLSSMKVLLMSGHFQAAKSTRKQLFLLFFREPKHWRDQCEASFVYCIPSEKNRRVGKNGQKSRCNRPPGSEVSELASTFQCSLSQMAFTLIALSSSFSPSIVFLAARVTKTE